MENLINSINNSAQTTRLLKPREVAGLLNVSRSYAYQLLQSGAIPTVHIGKSRRVRPQDLEVYIEHNTYSTETSN